MTDLSAMDERGLEALLSQPSDEVREMVAGLEGDIVVLGAGGKMGPTLAVMLNRAAEGRTIHAVSRFTDQAVKTRLRDAGVNAIQIDLMDEAQHAQLPPAQTVYFLAGMKFGSTGQQPLTWALNSFLPGRMAQHYRNAHMVVLSTGNVYPFVDPAQGGTKEDALPDPCGEYAQSCLGRERVCQYFSQQNQTSMTLVRLNYANEPRYGIIVDLTLKILQDDPIDLGMAAVNLIWQRDANDYIVRAINLARSPACILNVTGPDIVRIRELAGHIGRQLNREPRFSGEEGRSCLLSDAAYCFERLGVPATPLQDMIAMIVSWVASGKPLLHKPTKYHVRNGEF
jgi:nucleoside-diphosphate-sugar epimerase